MQKLSPILFLYSPPPPSENGATQRSDSSLGATAPKVVLIIGWMEARDVHLAKYVRQYQALFPTTAILLLKSSLLAVNVDSVGNRQAKEIAESLRAVMERDNDRQDLGRPELLVHVFSGGGSCMLHHLYSAYGEGTTAATGTAQQKFPLHMTVFDSSPTVFYYTPTVNAVLMGIPPQRWIRLLLLPAVHLLVMAWWLRIRVFHLSDVLAVHSSSHNDKAKNQETSRVYMYSDSDDIVPSSFVETHALEAEAKGFRPRREKFHGSSHVAHARKDPDRYWSAVRNAWEERHH